MVAQCLRYDSGGKEFKEVPASQETLSVADAVPRFKTTDRRKTDAPRRENKGHKEFASHFLYLDFEFSWTFKDFLETFLRISPISPRIQLLSIQALTLCNSGLPISAILAEAARAFVRTWQL